MRRIRHLHFILRSNHINEHAILIKSHIRTCQKDHTPRSSMIIHLLPYSYTCGDMFPRAYSDPYGGDMPATLHNE